MPTEPRDIYFTDTGATISGYPYPLVWEETDPEDRPAGPADLSNALSFMGCVTMESQLGLLKRRYLEITLVEGAALLHTVPPEVKIVTKLVTPLRSAKASHMLGDLLGVIAQCGLVAEMVAMLLFDIAELRHNGEPLDDPRQRGLFGNTFERLGQERRLAVLRAYDLITDDEVSAFTAIKDLRNKYLHAFSYEPPNPERDALTAYRHAYRLVFRILGSTDPGRPERLSEALCSFLERNGCPVPLEPPAYVQTQSSPRTPLASRMRG